MTHAPETSAINWLHFLVLVFSASFLYHMHVGWKFLAPKINTSKWFYIYILFGAVHCTGQTIKILIYELYVSYVLLCSISFRVCGKLCLGIEQFSNQRQNLIPDASVSRFAWHIYNKLVPEKESLYGAIFLGVYHGCYFESRQYKA